MYEDTMSNFCSLQNELDSSDLETSKEKQIQLDMIYEEDLCDATGILRIQQRIPKKKNNRPKPRGKTQGCVAARNKENT